ncbi:hypothetical protein XarbCFBP7408_10180 [Xanthomonas arboricola pv. guizotiae]|uniref:Uncharacterized protein n=1 Tax=Xanthomonas arboricola pv. guizotiae TaxID=487867 RepID=A0A2S6ZRR6_9XANT|nr:hypothetical protein XarbCFBP7409_18430 [Xanthomonas arboricola pv. guizotiae]PPU24024.1 hypothetical protein XarbCFBP7408_10180 [Xanthomonas arboricola pv. guizotiae]
MALAAVSSELMHAACQNGVPGFRRGTLEDRDGAGAVCTAGSEGFTSMQCLTFSRAAMRWRRRASGCAGGR